MKIIKKELYSSHKDVSKSYNRVRTTIDMRKSEYRKLKDFVENSGSTKEYREYVSREFCDHIKCPINDFPSQNKSVFCKSSQCRAYLFHQYVLDNRGKILIGVNRDFLLGENDEI